MLTIVIHEEAEEEIKASAAYYESVRAGLGENFLRELADGFGQIQRHPLAWGVLEDEFRRYLMPRFPYGVVYRIEEDLIYVLAVMHLHRKPSYWLDRS